MSDTITDHSQARIFEAIKKGAHLVVLKPGEELPPGDTLPGKLLVLVRDEDGAGPVAWKADSLFKHIHAVVFSTPALARSGVEFWVDRVAFGGRCALVICPEDKLAGWLSQIIGHEVEKQFMVLGLGANPPSDVALQLELLDARKHLKVH